MKRLFVLLVSLCVLAVGTKAGAHELRPGALGLQETAPGRFRVQWSPPAVTRGEPWVEAPRFPEHCRRTPLELDCGARGLAGAITFPGLETTLARVVVYVTYADGSTTSAVVGAASPSLLLEAKSSALSRLEVARQYTVLGFEHIVTGFDHLLFVLGLLLLVDSKRKLLLTVTAFTLAHSVTLAASVLGLVSVPQAPVETVIALSILLLAVECSRPGDSLSRRAPWVVALSFGLLHGFGFAGALREVGLPAGQVPLGLLSFNVGVELGQLAAVTLAWLGARALPHGASLAWAERGAVYAMGSLAAYWSFERALATFGAG